MEDKSNIKQIIINPELFNISNQKNKTSKKLSPKNNKNNTISRSQNPKNKILKHIQNIYNEKKQNKKNILKNLFVNDNKTEKFNNEFDNSIEYLLNISNENNLNNNQNNLNTNEINVNTIQNINNVQNKQNINNIQNKQNIINNENLINTIDKNIENTQYIIPNTISNITPKYGCLKNGKLPTYKNYMNILKNPRNNINKSLDKSNINISPIINISSPFTKNENGLHKFLNTNINNKNDKEINDKGINDKIIDNKEINNKEINDKEINNKLNNIIKKYNKKRIIRRTFKLGKYKKEPKVGVLISNKTIRNQINNKIKEIYEIPISDIKTFLIKKGLIKIGSTAPTDILREMYKNVIMLCGDLQNHNTENVLYNYLHDNNTI